MAKSADEPRKTARLRELLSTHPLYNASHWVSVVQTDKGYSASYWPSSSRISNLENGEGGFDMEIREEVGDILEIRAKKGQQGQGQGAAFYNIIEAFCKEQGCKKIQTAPSGQGKKFWPKMGFEYSEKGLAYKLI